MLMICKISFRNDNQANSMCLSFYEKQVEEHEHIFLIRVSKVPCPRTYIPELPNQFTIIGVQKNVIER